MAAGLPSGAMGAQLLATVALAPAGADSAAAMSAASRSAVTAALAEAGTASAAAAERTSRAWRIARRYRGDATEGNRSAPDVAGWTVAAGAAEVRRCPRRNITQPATPPASSAGISGRL